jgi:hypothetical protein
VRSAERELTTALEGDHRRRPSPDVRAISLLRAVASGLDAPDAVVNLAPID